MNLQDILAAMSDLDNAAEVDINPKELVGVLEDKVDAIKTVIDRLNLEASRLYTDADALMSRARRVEKNAASLKEWVRMSMVSHGFTKLPGRVWSAQLKRCAPMLEVERGPTAEDFKEAPTWVARKVFYAWDKEAIKKAIAAGLEFKYGHIVENYSVQFPPRKGA